MLVTNNNLHQRHELKYYVLDHNEAMSSMDAAIVKKTVLYTSAMKNIFLDVLFT